MCAEHLDNQLPTLFCNVFASEPGLKLSGIDCAFGYAMLRRHRTPQVNGGVPTGGFMPVARWTGERRS